MRSLGIIRGKTFNIVIIYWIGRGSNIEIQAISSRTNQYKNKKVKFP